MQSLYEKVVMKQAAKTIADSQHPSLCHQEEDCVWMQHCAQDEFPLRNSKVSSTLEEREANIDVVKTT